MDVHTENAKTFFNKEQITEEERKFIKRLNFGLCYGAGPNVVNDMLTETHCKICKNELHPTTGVCHKTHLYKDDTDTSLIGHEGPKRCKQRAKNKD